MGAAVAEGEEDGWDEGSDAGGGTREEKGVVTAEGEEDGSDGDADPCAGDEAAGGADEAADEGVTENAAGEGLVGSSEDRGGVPVSPQLPSSTSDSPTASRASHHQHTAAVGLMRTHCSPTSQVVDSVQLLCPGVGWLQMHPETEGTHFDSAFPDT